MELSGRRIKLLLVIESKATIFHASYMQLVRARVASKCTELETHATAVEA